MPCRLGLHDKLQASVNLNNKRLFMFRVLKHSRSIAYLSATFICCYLFPGVSYANLEIFSPVIEPDVWEAETTASYTQDSDRELDDQFDQVIEIEHAITPRWLAAFGAGFQNGPGMGLEHVSTRFENVYWLTPGDSLSFEAGLYFEYIHRHGRDRLDTIEFKVLLEKDWERFYGLANLSLEKELGRGREPGEEPEYALRLMHRLNDYNGIGLEAYGEVDEKNHILGPMYYHETEFFEREIEIGFGWLTGISDNAPEGTLLIQFGINLGGY